MKITFYQTAVLLGIVAFFLNSMAYDHWMQASRHKAYSIEAAMKQHIMYVRDMEAVRLAHTGNVLSVVGLAVMLFGVSCMVAAIMRREKGWYLILTGLFVADVFVLMLC